MVTAIARFVAEMRGVSRITDRNTWWRYLTAVLGEFPRILLNRSLRTADARMGDREFVFSLGSGKQVSLVGACFGLAREIYGRKIYTAIEGFEIKEGNVVVDLGANAGVFSVMAGVFGARVVAVEAQSGFIPILEQNLIRNHVREWAVEWGLIGGETGVLSSKRERRNAAHWGVEVPKITLDQLMEKHQLTSIDFLKIDIEGSEFDLFRGYPQWLTRVKRITMEVHQEFGSCRELAEFLQGNGFDVTITDNEQSPVAELQGNYGFIFAIRQGSVDVGRNEG